MKKPVKSFPEEVAKLDICNEKDQPTIAEVCNALSNPIRINILNQLQERSYTIPELAELNNISITNCVFHTSLLADVALIRIELVPSNTRNVRMCYRLTREVNINLFRPVNIGASKKSYTSSCSVGEYCDISDDTELRFATEEGFRLFDNAFSKNRYEAGLIWSVKGTISYNFPYSLLPQESLGQIDIYLELCSEVANYNNEFKSDITFWINGHELFTHTSPGDYGDRPGFLNPEWLKKDTKATQYGDLYHIRLCDNHVYLNDVLVNDNLSIESLGIDKNSRKILLTIGNKKNATNIGGWNIFGKNFGDYPIDIKMVQTIK